jgi:tetratricopeptide (TPR) repeat protein
VRDLGRFEEAIEDLRPAILAAPENAILWNTMGTIVAEQGDYPTALVFYAEALRQQPDFSKAQYNVGNARLVLGDAQGALDACNRAIEGVLDESDRLMMRIAKSTILMALGRIGEGWDEYEARRDTKFADVLHFLCDKEEWQPGCDLAGKSLLVFTEQGLGDEVLFANVLHDLIERLGPDGLLTLSVEPRLVPLFQRSFPKARVGPHATYKVQGHDVRYAPFLNGTGDIDLWAPIGSLLREFRRTLDAFPTKAGFLTPDPDRVAYWRKVLDEQAPQGPKVGLLWKSAIGKDARHRFFSPFEAWAPVLETPGVSFVNLQYDDCSKELATAERDFGAKIWQPPGIDLKQDLDDVAALSAALDLVVGFSNATFNLAAAAGAPVWLISTPGSWPRLGTLRYPWYPQARVFMTPTFGEWDGVMGAMAEALGEFASKPR